MRNAALATVMLNLVFVFIITASSLFTGVASAVVYYCAFIVPISVFFVCKLKTKIKLSPPRFTVSAENARLGAATVFPTIAIVFVISWLTSIVASEFGVDSLTDVSGNLVHVILTKAVLTAVLEELLFRYIPLSLISPYSRRSAIILSAAFFALAHCNIYQLFYAFIAGVIFAILDLAFDSIVPSLVIHFANNLVSIFWLRNGGSAEFVRWYVISILSLAALSSIPIIILRRKYIRSLRAVFCNDGKIEFTVESAFFILFMLLLTILSI